MVTETTDERRKEPLNGTTITAVTLAGLSLLTQFLTGNLNIGGAGNRPPAGDPPWSRDMNYERQLTERDAKIGKLEAQIYTDDKVDAVRRELQATTAAQQVFNATTMAAVATTRSHTEQLMKMTGLVISGPVMAASEAAASAFKAGGTSAATANG